MQYTSECSPLSSVGGFYQMKTSVEIEELKEKGRTNFLIAHKNLNCQ
ncbi:hypothetical protein BH18THE2_BH18THE2_36250 [soil metagenome]